MKTSKCKACFNRILYSKRTKKVNFGHLGAFVWLYEWTGVEPKEF